jgi:hypothetical protein
VKTKGLRIATRYTSIAELVAKLYPYCDGDSLFVGTRDAQAVGIEAPFALQLADQTFALRGWCVVLESWATPDNPFHKPGLRLQLSRLTPESQAVLAQLQAASRSDSDVDAAAAAVASAADASAADASAPDTAAADAATSISEPALGDKPRSRRATLQPVQGQLRKPAPIPLAVLAARGRIESGPVGGLPRFARGSGPEPDPGDNPLLDLSVVSLEDLIENRLAESEGSSAAEAEAEGGEPEGDDDGQTLAQPWRILTPPKPTRAPTWATPPPSVAKTPAPVLMPAPPSRPSAEMPVEPSLSPAVAPPAEPAADPATEISPDLPTEVLRGGTVIAPPTAVLPGRLPARPATPAPISADALATHTPAPRAVTPRPPTPAPAMHAPLPRATTPRPPTPAPAIHAPLPRATTPRPPTPAPAITSSRPATPLPFGPVLPLQTSPHPPSPARSSALRWGLAIAAAVILIGGAVAAALAI